MTTPRRNLAVGAVALLCLPLVMAARAPINGTEQTKTAVQVFADARAAMSAAKSFHVLGHLESNGAAEVLNLSMSPKGGGGSVEVSGATLEIVVAAGTVYIKADQKSWMALTGSKATAELVANRWIKVPATNANFASFGELTDSKTFVSQLTSSTGLLAKLHGTSTWAGHQAVVLTDRQGDKLYIANVGTPYMLHIEGHGHGSSGTITFSDFGDAPMPAVPTGAISLPGS